MSKNKNNSTAEKTPLEIAVNILIGSLINIILFFALAAAFSLICLKTDAAPEMLKYPVFVAGGIGGFFGGLTALGKIRKRGMLFGALSAAPALLIILLTCSLVSRTGIAPTGWITAGISIVTAAIGGILGANKRK